MIKRIFTLVLTLALTVSLFQYPCAVKASEATHTLEEIKDASQRFYGVDITNLDFRGTTIVYLATTVLVRDRTAGCSIEDKINAVLYGVAETKDVDDTSKYISILPDTAFDSPSKYRLDNGYTYNYLVDTISTDSMRTRYLSTSDGVKHNYPLVSLDSTAGAQYYNKNIEQYINATMNSATMSSTEGAENFMLTPADYLNGTPTLEYIFLNKVYNYCKNCSDSVPDYKIPELELRGEPGAVTAVKTGDYTINGPITSPKKTPIYLNTMSDDGPDIEIRQISTIEIPVAEMSDPIIASYDWTSYAGTNNTCKILTAVVPIIVPTFRTSAGYSVNPIGCNTTSYIKEKNGETAYLYSNQEFVANLVGITYSSPYQGLSGYDRNNLFHKIKSDNLNEYISLNNFKTNLVSNTEPMSSLNHLYEKMYNLAKPAFVYISMYMDKVSNLPFREFCVINATMSGWGLGYAGADIANAFSPAKYLDEEAIAKMIVDENTKQLKFSSGDTDSIESTYYSRAPILASTEMYAKATSNGNISNILAGRCYNIKANSGVTNILDSTAAINFQNCVNLLYGDRSAYFVTTDGKSADIQYLLAKSLNDDTIGYHEYMIYENPDGVSVREEFLGISGRVSADKLLLSQITGATDSNGAIHVEESDAGLTIKCKLQGGYFAGYNVYAYIDTDSLSEDKKDAYQALYEILESENCKDFTKYEYTQSSSRTTKILLDSIDQFTKMVNNSTEQIYEEVREELKNPLDVEVVYIATCLPSDKCEDVVNEGFVKAYPSEHEVFIPFELVSNDMHIVLAPVYKQYVYSGDSQQIKQLGFQEAPPEFSSYAGDQGDSYANTSAAAAWYDSTAYTTQSWFEFAYPSDEPTGTYKEIAHTPYGFCKWSEVDGIEYPHPYRTSAAFDDGRHVTLLDINVDKQLEAVGGAWGAKVISNTEGSVSEVIQSPSQPCNIMAEMAVDVYPQVLAPGVSNAEESSAPTFEIKNVSDGAEITDIKLLVEGLSSDKSDSKPDITVAEKANAIIGSTVVSKYKGTEVSTLKDSIKYYSPSNHEEGETKECSYCKMCEDINNILKKYYITVDSFALSDKFGTEDCLSNKFTFKLTFDLKTGTDIVMEIPIDVNAYEWSGIVSVEETDPANVKDVGPEGDLSFTWVSKIIPTDSANNGGQLFQYYPYKFTNQLFISDEAKKIAEFELNALSTEGNIGSQMTQMLAGSKPNYTMERTPLFTEKGSSMTWGGTFTKKALEAGEDGWIISNVLTCYPAKRDNIGAHYENYRFSIKGDYMLDWTEKTTLYGKFDKSEAEPFTESIKLGLDVFNYNDFGLDWGGITTDDVTFHKKNKSINIKIEDISVTTKSTGETKIILTWQALDEKKTYYVHDFYVRIKGKDFPLAATEIVDKGYTSVTVPRSFPDPIFNIEVSPGGREFEVSQSAGEISIDYVAKFTPNMTDKQFERWSKMIFSQEGVKAPNGLAWARIKLNINTTGDLEIVSIEPTLDGVAKDLSSPSKATLEIYWKETTNTKLAELISNTEIPFKITFKYPANVEGTVNFGVTSTGAIDAQSGNSNSFGRICFSKANKGKVTQEQDCASLVSGEDVIRAKAAKSACIEWEQYTNVRTPYAVLTPTAPRPEDWRWDTMSGIPNTESLSATVGADLYRIGVTGRTHGLGFAAGQPTKANNEAGKIGSPLKNPVTKRTITFEVNFTDWWGAEDSIPCTLNCPEHTVCSGGGSNSGAALSDSVSSSSSASVSKTVAHNIPAWKCVCGFEYAGHSCTQSATATGEDAIPAVYGTDEDGNQIVVSEAVPAVTDTQPITCSESYTHNCTWTYKWSCETGTGRFSKRGPDCGASDAPQPLKSTNEQRTNLTLVTVTNGDEVVTGNYVNQATLDMGFTTNYGCVCSKDHNMAHREKHKEVFTIYEDSDSVVWKAIDNFYISALSNAEIIRADEAFDDCMGRTVLTNGLEFAMWRADDGGILTYCEEGGSYPDGAANSLAQTGRMYYTDFKNPNAEGAVLNPSTYTTSDVVIKFTIPVNRATSFKYVEQNGSIAESIAEYVKATIYRGSTGGQICEDGCGAGDHFDDSSVTSNVTQYKTGYPGDKSTPEELARAAALLVNNWLLSNQADNFYKINFVGDGVTVKYDGLYQNVAGWAYSIPGADVNLFNCTFDTARREIWRNHVNASADLQTTVTAAQDAPTIVNINSAKLFVGFGGNYAPASADTMYIRNGSVSPFNYVESLGEGEVLFDKGYNTNTNFNRTSPINTSIYTASGNPGLTKGSITLSGSGTVTTGEEHYGDSVSSVSDDVVQTMNPQGTTETGESLLSFHLDGFTITDNTRMSFLGLTLKEDTPNKLIKDPMTIQCNYKCMFKYIGNRASDKAETIESLAEDFSVICKPPQGYTEGDINPLVVLNPVAVDAWMIGNKRGATSIYDIDESHEDMRTDSSKRLWPGEYVVIGNTFNVWITDIGPKEAPVTSTRETQASAYSWGSGLSADNIDGEIQKGTHGYGACLNTGQWVDQRTISFNFPVNYVAHNGEVIHCKAGQIIRLDSDSIYDPAVDLPTDCPTHVDLSICKGQDFAEDPDDPYNYFEDYGRGYTFTCELSARETMTAIMTVTNGNSLGTANTNGFYSTYSNYTDRSEVEANSIAQAQTRFALVGRIGDIVLTDTQDYRYSNLFWEATDKWLIPDIVKETSLVSRLNLRTAHNILMMSTPVYGSVNANESGNSEVTTGVVNSQLRYPLQASSNNIQEFKSTNLGLGYSAYFGLTTIGEYTGQNNTTMYPKSFEEALTNPLDLRSNYVTVVPIYALYDKDTEKFYDIDLYAGSGVNYELFYDYTVAQPNYTNAMYSTLDDATEQSRYAVSDFAKYYSMFYNDTPVSAFTSKAYVGTSRQIILDERSNIVVGVRDANDIPINYDLDNDKFLFTESVYGPETTPSAQRTTGGQATADYALNARRWFFNLGLPTSTIAVYPGTYDTPLAIVQANQKLLDEHPNSVIVCFLQVKAKGEVFELLYDTTYNNAYFNNDGSTAIAGTLIDLAGKSVNYMDMPVYINEKTQYTLGAHMFPVFLCDVQRTSTQDLGMQGTN